MSEQGQHELHCNCRERLESELSSLRAEVERLQATVEARERLLDRFTANNIKLNEELSGLRAALSEARKET